MADAILIPENPILMAIKTLTAASLADTSSTELDGSEDPIAAESSLFKQIQTVEEASQKLQVALQILETNKLKLIEIHTRISTSIKNAMLRFESNHCFTEGNPLSRYKIMHSALATIEDGSIIDGIEKKVYAIKLREAIHCLSIAIEKAKDTFEEQMLATQKKSIPARLSMLKEYIASEQGHFKKIIAEQTHVAISASATPPLDSKPPL